MARTIALVGGAGFIGTQLAGRLLAAGYDVRIIDKRQSSAFPELWANGDVRNPDSLRKTFEGCSVVYNLAAEHKDNVQPRNLYGEVNVDGAREVCRAADQAGIRTIIFTSSVAVYGFTRTEVDEHGSLAPFNDYGRTKMEAEEVYRQWLSDGSGSTQKSLTIVRPTVVFGEGNRGNVYNLFRQIEENRFFMVGRGTNAKSMAYVENVAAFLEYALSFGPGEHLYNYVDKPDFSMNDLVLLIKKKLGRAGGVGARIPYWAGYLGGLFFDALSFITHREFPISAVRIGKFCASTRFSSSRIGATGFEPPVGIEEGIERTIENEFLKSKGSTT